MDLYMPHGIAALLAFCGLTAICIGWSVLISNTLRSRCHAVIIGDATKDSARPKISVIVPARNEEGGIAKCLGTLLKQDYPDYEVIVVDDGSDDRTYDIMKTFKDRNVLVLRTEKPDGWMGKTWACSEAAKKASGEILLFTDADTEHETDSLSKTVSHMMEHKLDCLSLAPRLRMDTVWARAVLPLITSFKLVKPRGIILYSMARANDPHYRMGGFNGSYLLITADAYRKICGFASVKDELFEDWALGLIAQDKMLRTCMADGRGLVKAAWARDLHSLNEIFGRLTVQMAGRGRMTNARDFILLAVLMFAPYPAAAASCIVFMLYPGVFTAVVAAGSLASVLFQMAAHAVHARALGLSVHSVFLAPLGGLVAAAGFLRGITAGSTTWRGRRIAAEDMAGG